MSREESPRGEVKSISFDEALKLARGFGRLSTGSEGIDALTGGGYEECKITEVFGPSNSGKTQLAIQATVMAAARGWSSVFVDTESTFRPERAVQMAEARGLAPDETLARIFSLRARDVEAQAHVLERVVDDPRVSSAKLVVIDTVTKNFSLEFPDRVGRRQGALGVYLNRIAIDAYLHRRIVLLTNRVASVTRNGTTQDVNLGGLTLGRFVSKSIRVRRQGSYVYANVEYPRNAAPPIKCQLSERGFE